MRLLSRRNGNIHLTDDLFDHEVPPYAVLSHTWGSRNEEVTFSDMVTGVAKQKTGYRKIEFCSEQAAKDGLQYFWVDSCCIDKDSSAELQESLNSMFRWYQQAKKCYVYMTDVHTAEQHGTQFPIHDFQKSRWFTRGWTLQELLAPPRVEFYSRQGKFLGDKRSLERLIHDITGIDIAALRGAPLAQFTIDERFAWARNRQTMRPEDQAYSLLGILGIFLPVLYGEGRESAMYRAEGEIIRSSKRAKEKSLSSTLVGEAPLRSNQTTQSSLRSVYEVAENRASTSAPSRNQVQNENSKASGSLKKRFFRR